jgi:hypothetical protein
MSKISLQTSVQDNRLVEVTNPEELQKNLSWKKKSMVNSLCVWIDRDNPHYQSDIIGEEKFQKLFGNSDGFWKTYYYQRNFKTKFEQSNPLALAHSYFGSSKGQNAANPDMLRDMKLSSKKSQVSILEICETQSATYVEQKWTTKHNFPVTGKNSDDCYNKNNVIGKGTVKHQTMMSVIQFDMLSEKLTKHFNGDTQYEEVFLDRDYLKTLIEEERYVQSREKKEGNVDTISYYTLKMSEKLDWNGKVTLYMPENKNIDEAWGGDGNQSSRACIAVKNMPGLQAVTIPWEEHCFLLDEEKKSIGNLLNAYPEFREDNVSIEDAMVNCINIILRDKKLLLTKTGNLRMNHPLLWDKLKLLNFSPLELRLLSSGLNSHFKKERDIKLKTQDGTYDFSDKAISIKTDDNGNKIPNKNREHWLKAENKILSNFKKNLSKEDQLIFNENTHTYKLTSGISWPAKIADFIFNYGFKNGNEKPKNLLVFVTFDLQLQYDKHADHNGNWLPEKQAEVDYINQMFKGINITIVPVPNTKKTVG